MILFLAVWCRPVNWYWKVPVPNCMYPSVLPDASQQLTNRLLNTTAQCASYYNHLIDDAVFNITSDLLILSLPIPLLIKAQLPLKRSVITIALFNLHR